MGAFLSYIIERLKTEWEIVAGTPILFSFCVALATCLAGFVIYSLVARNYEVQYSGRIATLQATIQLHQATIQLQSVQLSSRSDEPNQKSLVTAKPALQLSMLGASIFKPDAPDARDLTGVAVVAQVWNLGEPSVATKWKLLIITPGMVPVLAQFTAMADDIKASGVHNSQVIRLSDALYNKVSAEPISRIPQVGNLVFFARVDQDLVMNKDTVLELSVYDVYGTETTSRQRVGDWMGR